MSVGRAAKFVKHNRKESKRTMASHLLQELATKLADQKAVEVILSLPAVIIDSLVWRNTQGHDVAWECKYLHLRGLLRRNPDNEDLVLLRRM